MSEYFLINASTASNKALIQKTINEILGVASSMKPALPAL